MKLGLTMRICTKRRSTASQRGFTLVELMIVVAVVGVLAAVAYPSCAEYVRRSHRSDARAGLLQAQQWLERAATATGTYPTALPGNLTWAADTTKRYIITLNPATPAAFTLTAAPRAGTPQVGDRCGSLSVTNTGVRNAAPLSGGATVAECWRK